MDEKLTRTEEELCETPAAEPSEAPAEPTDKKTVRELLAAKQALAAAEAALAEAEKNRAEQEDKYLRLAAEYDNFRKRSATERQSAYTDGLEEALAKLLPILDNLERAALYTDAEKVGEGLSMIARAAAEALAAMGVAAYGEPGESFDPNLHNAVMHVEDESRGEGEITEVHQRGYKKGDRILRYAMVSVAN